MEIEQEYQKLVNSYNPKTKTSCKDVLRFMVDNSKKKIWWWSWEFVGKSNSRGGYLSHRAPARASDLALHTNLVEDRRIGRFKVYRAKMELIKEINEYLKD